MRILGVGLLIGFLLNVTGWLGNNLLLGDLWASVEFAEGLVAWRASPWRDVFSFVPDFVYGLGIAWLVVAFRPKGWSWRTTGLIAGLWWPC